MAKRKKKIARKKKPGRRPGVAGMSIAQLEAAIARRKAAEVTALKAKRRVLAKQVGELDTQIAALGGAAPRRGPGRPKKAAKKAAKKKVVRKKRRAKKTAKKAAKKAGRVRSSAEQIARVQDSILKALKGKKGGLLKLELTKAVRAREQTLNTALKKLLTAKKLKTKGVTRNTRYMAA